MFAFHCGRYLHTQATTVRSIVQIPDNEQDIKWIKYIQAH